MDIVVIGGTSRTGVHVVEQAVARGHRVTVFCRDAAKVPPHLAAHRVVTGDARDAVALRSAVAGQDAVVCILAPDGTGPTRLVSDCVAALLPAMRDAGVERVVLCSARPVVATRPALVIGLLWLWLRNAYRDLARAEGMLQTSGLDWRIGRPGRLVDGEGLGRYAVDDADEDDARGARTMARSDLARALLDLAEAEAPDRAWQLGGCGMTGLLVLQLAHVLTGVIWAGGQVVTSVAVLPALLGLPAPRAREVLDALGSRLGPVMGLTGTTAMLLGIVRGAVYGPIRSFDVLLSTPYGQTFGLALVLSVLGAIHGARTEQRLAGLFEGDGYRPDARRRVLVDAVVVVGLMGGIVACMVAMHFGL